jgi:hypothetical protein
MLLQPSREMEGADRNVVQGRGVDDHRDRAPVHLVSVTPIAVFA